ncbi:MAG: hypothetical protein AVDCRST_MAG02-4696, partial [uncultured Rubrobacteraceae bacterium]
GHRRLLRRPDRYRGRRNPGRSGRSSRRTAGGRARDGPV